MVNDRRAQAVLTRFRTQINHAARLTVSGFEPAVELDDAMQEASLLVLSYAGIIKGTHYRTLMRAERDAEGNEQRVRKIISSKLKRDLMQELGRLAVRTETCASLENLPESREPTHDPEDGWISRMDLKGYVRKEYPYLYMTAVEELPQDIIAAITGQTDRTIRNRLAIEKRKAQRDPYFVEARA